MSPKIKILLIALIFTGAMYFVYKQRDRLFGKNSSSCEANDSCPSGKGRGVNIKRVEIFAPDISQSDIQKLSKELYDAKVSNVGAIGDVFGSLFSMGEPEVKKYIDQIPSAKSFDAISEFYSSTYGGDYKADFRSILSESESIYANGLLASKGINRVI